MVCWFEIILYVYTYIRSTVVVYCTAGELVMISLRNLPTSHVPQLSHATTLSVVSNKIRKIETTAHKK